MAEYWGHSENGNGSGVPEKLCAHIQAVTECACRFAADFGADGPARVAGLLHDLGKYAEQFQRRVRGLEPHGRDHASAGALIATTCYKSHGILAALAIEGHHIGLAQLREWRDYASELARRMHDTPGEFTTTNVSTLVERFEQDGFAFPRIDDAWKPSGEFSASDMLDVRMLFSALVDADFLETEAHFAGDANTPRRPRPAGPTLNPERALAAVLTRIDALRSQKAASDGIHDARQSLLSACLDAAVKYPRGLFTLSAPTGSGKTLAMLAFALRHAAEYKLRRVVLVMPFLNIIDQTADEYRLIFRKEAEFDQNFVIEDHSNVQPPDRDGRATGAPADAQDEATRLGRLLAENWDAPIVLTTSVQCLESLMANRPGPCRKLHRLANSVILFDEVQTLPPHLAAPTLAALSRLSERFGTTVVFATATQPAFDHFHQAIMDAKLASTGWQATEIVPEELRAPLFKPAAERVRVHWRHGDPISWEVLAGRLAEEKQVLCVVNLKRHARRVAEVLRELDPSGLFHLSTNMCPAHRMVVLESVRTALDAQRPVRLVATQCVEAGVDLDFPVVWRALGPLEAIAQAAGRCNRHGLLSQRGQVHVFQPERDGRYLFPPGAYTQAAAATEVFLKSLAEPPAKLDGLEILNDPAQLRAYYWKFLYALTGAAAMSRELKDALDECDFRDVAREYRLIDTSTINILVPYDRQAFDALRSEADEGFGSLEAIRLWVRHSGPHAVSPYRPGPNAPIWNHLRPVQFSRRRPVDNDEAEWFIALDGMEYNAIVGLIEQDHGFLMV